MTGRLSEGSGQVRPSLRSTPVVLGGGCLALAPTLNDLDLPGGATGGAGGEGVLSVAGTGDLAEAAGSAPVLKESDRR